VSFSEGIDYSERNDCDASFVHIILSGFSASSVVNYTSTNDVRINANTCYT
jgi:hypothetical protein